MAEMNKEVQFTYQKISRRYDLKGLAVKTVSPLYFEIPAYNI